MDFHSIALFHLLFAFNAICLVFTYNLESLDTSSPCPIYLTISPISRHVEDAYLEINWGPRCPNPADWIGLYAEDPSTTYTETFYKIITKGETTGHVKTNMKLGKLHLKWGWDRKDAEIKSPEHTSTSICLPYYVASYIKNKLQTIDCLKLNPMWMSTMQQIQNVPLKRLFIPGTHCSACYEQRTANSRAILLKRFGFVQNFDVWTQLVFGVRFLDISLGYIDSTNGSFDYSNFWVVNENLCIAPLIPILRDIRLFAERSNEVIVIDFSDFPIGFYNHPVRHSLFAILLERELGDIIYKRSSDNNLHSGDLTIDMIRGRSKNVIVLYNNEEIVAVNSLIWLPWRKFTTQNLQSTEIVAYIGKIFSKKFENSPVDVPWIIHGIHGISSSYSPGLHLPSARDRANAINKVFTDLISNAWSLNANVVAFDFFLSCNLIDMAINANIQKNVNNTNHVIINIDE